MKSTGMVRAVDKMGRVVIPKKYGSSCRLRMTLTALKFIWTAMRSFLKNTDLPAFFATL